MYECMYACMYVYLSQSIWGTSTAQLPLTLDSVKPRFQCWLQSTQLCTIYVKTKKLYSKWKCTQEWCSIMFSDKTADRRQRTEERQWPVSALSKRSNSSSDFRFKRNGHFFNWQDGTNSSYFTVYLKNVQHSSKNARGYILQNAHTVAWALFCNALYITYASYMYVQ